MFWIKEKFVSLHRKTEMKCSIGLWCNGNTTDSVLSFLVRIQVAQHNTPIKTH